MDSSTIPLSLLMDYTVNPNPQSQVRVEWSNGSHSLGQDVCIRLVQSSSNNEPGADQNDAVLAYVLVHSSYLMKFMMNINSSFFRGIGDRIAPANTTLCISSETHLPVVTLNVDRDDVQAYIDCFRDFTMMYDLDTMSFRLFSPQTGVEGLRYTLKLLGAASHIDHYHLMLAITSHLTTSIPWSSEENLTVLRETPIRKEGLRYFIQRLLDSPEETADELIERLLETARVQGWRPFEQEVVAMVHEDLNRFLVEAHNACDGKDSWDLGMFFLPSKLMNICKILVRLMRSHVASQGVRCFLQYPSIPKFLSSLTTESDQTSVAVVRRFKTIVVLIYSAVVAKHVILANSDRYTLLRDWTNFLEGYEKAHKVRRGLGSHYKRAKEAIFGSLSSKQKIELVHMTAEHGYYFTFGKPEKLLKSLKNSTVARESED